MGRERAAGRAAPDPERTYTAPELAAGQQLVDVHDHLRAELAQVRDLIGQVLRRRRCVPARAVARSTR